MNPQALIQRLSVLQAEGQAIMQQLAAAGMAEEEIMAALQGGVPQPGMGAGPGPDTMGGIEATNVAMGVGGGPQGLLGNVS